MNKKILFGVIFAVFLMLMMPVNSAVESKAVENNKLNKISLTLINKIKKSVMEKNSKIPPPEPTFIILFISLKKFCTKFFNSSANWILWPSALAVGRAICFILCGRYFSTQGISDLVSFVFLANFCT